MNFFCLKSQTSHTRPCKSVPQNPDKPLHTMQYHALDFWQAIPRSEYSVPDSEHAIAYHAILCLGFRTDHSQVGILCPRFRTRHCIPCNNMPQTQGMLFRPWNGLSQISGTIFRLRNGFPQIQGRVFRPRNAIFYVSVYLVICI